MNELEVGMVLSNTLYDDNANVLLRSNKALSKGMITRIKNLNYENGFFYYQRIVSE